MSFIGQRQSQLFYGKMTMLVNMAYEPKSESVTKVLKMVPPSNGIVDIAINSEKHKQWSFSTNTVKHFSARQ